MEENQVNLGALAAAYYRAYHAIHDDPKIFYDYLANRLITEGERVFLERLFTQLFESIDPASAAPCPEQTTALAQSMRAIPFPPIALSRNRYAEDSLKMAVRHGVRQYVNLGAGMDTFAFRCPEMLEQLQVFEVDHPATQYFKRRRIAELGWEQPAQLHFVPVDFTQEDLATALTHSSYDPQTLSFFSWLGVTFYLPREAVFATLRAFANVAPAGSTIVFDYLDTDAFIPGKAAPRVQSAIEKLQQVGEPWITGFDPTTLATDFARLGLRFHENLNPSDIQERYFKGLTDGYYACEHVHFAWAVVA